MSSIIDEINQAMPPGAVLDVTLETVQNLATALIRARAHITELQDIYNRAKEYAAAMESPRIPMPKLSTEYMELRDAIDRADCYRGFSSSDDEIKKAHYKQLLAIQEQYFKQKLAPVLEVACD